MSVKSAEMSEKVRRPKRQEITKTDKLTVYLIAKHVQREKNGGCSVQIWKTLKCPH